MSFTLIVKDCLYFHQEEPDTDSQEVHSKWFNAFWWKRPNTIMKYDNKEEALEQGLLTPHPYWWIVLDADGKTVDGGY